MRREPDCRTGLEGLRYHDEHPGRITTGTAAGGRFQLRIPVGLSRNRVENRIPGIHRPETGGDPEIRRHRVGGDGVFGPGVPGAMRRHGSGREGQPDGGGSRQGRGRKGQATRPMRGAVTVLGQPDRRIPGTGLAQIPITANSKAVWVSLIKRSTPERDPLQFFYACERGITGWRGHQKQTTLERREYYQKIYNIADRLEDLMLHASAFDSYSIDEVVSDQSIERLKKILRNSISSTDSASKKDPDIRFLLSVGVPKINEVLRDIKQKAGQYRDERTIVKKPNAENAKVHYFARQISDYCRKTYSQLTSTPMAGLPGLLIIR